MSDDLALDIIVTGHLCLDLLPRMENISAQELATPGRLWEVGPLDVATGGSVSNTGLALHRLGVRVGLMATVGDDLIGQAIIGYLNARDPALSQLIATQHGQPSSYTVVLSPGRADRSFLHCTGTNSTFDETHIAFDYLKQARVFHLGYPPLLPRLMERGGERLEALYRRAKAMGVVTAMDMVMPDPQRPSGQADWAGILRRVLPYVDIFLPSIEEILFMLRRSDYEAWQGWVLPNLTAAYLYDLADELLAMGAVIAGFKLGEMGMYLRTADTAAFERLRALNIDVNLWANVELWQPAFEVQVVGTTGAGDSAYAGFLAALLRGYGPDEALRWACAVGACNVEAADAVSGIRTWDETQRRIESGWPTRPMRLSGYSSAGA